MTLNLPDRPSLEHLKYQARDLLPALKDGDASAARRIKQHLPKATNLTKAGILTATFRLNDAQLVIAREYGFESWPKLRQHVESAKINSDLNGAESIRRVFSQEVPEIESGLVGAWASRLKQWVNQ